MYIGKKYNLKYFSINLVFGLFLLSCLLLILPYAFNLLSKNFHDTTFIYVFLGITIGVVSMMLFDYKYDNCDDISIFCFAMCNCYFLSKILNYKFSFMLLIINILFYVSIGLYIRNGKSWISVFGGMFAGFILFLLGGYWLGYMFSISFGIISCFIYSISQVVFRNRTKYAYFALFVGMLLAFLGCFL
jgi:hypothetical protein